MKLISYDDAMEYTKFMPPPIEFRRDDYLFRGIIIITSIIVATLWHSKNLIPAIISFTMSIIMLMFSMKAFAIKFLRGPYTLFSDSLSFLNLSLNLMLINAYILTMISDDFCIGFVVSFLMNMFDVIVIGLYALIMLKKKWYKGNGVQTGKPTVIGITAAAFGYLYAQHAFKNSTVNQSLCILAVVIMIGMFLINIGLIGFIKYYCYVQINSADNRQDV